MVIYEDNCGLEGKIVDGIRDLEPQETTEARSGPKVGCQPLQPQVEVEGRSDWKKKYKTIISNILTELHQQNNNFCSSHLPNQQIWTQPTLKGLLQLLNS